MLRHDRNNHRRILRALTLVNGRRVRRPQHVELAKPVGDGSAIKVDDELALGRIDIIDVANVTIIDVLVIIILDLHDLIAGCEGPAEAFDLAIPRGIERGLQFDVQGACTNPASVHRTQHLDVPDGVEAEALGNLGLNQLDDARHGSFGIIRLHEIEVAVRAGRPKVGDRALVDAMGADDDAALCRLSEHLGEAYYRHRAGCDDVRQHLARANRGQLVDVAYDQDVGLVGHRFQECLHQHDVDHRGLVDYQQVAIERFVVAALEAAASGVNLQEPVDGLGIEPGRLAHPLAGPAGGAAGETPRLVGCQHAQDPLYDGGLAHTGTAGHDQNLGHERKPNRAYLAFRKDNPNALLAPRQRLGGV